MKEIFVKRSIEVLPNKMDTFLTDVGYSRFFPKREPHAHEWWNPSENEIMYPTFWLEPITPEQFLSENPEIVEKITKELDEVKAERDKLYKLHRYLIPINNDRECVNCGSTEVVITDHEDYCLDCKYSYT